MKPAKIINNSMFIKPIALSKDFCLRIEVYITFCLELSNITIGKTISRFKVNITNIIKYIDYIYYSYSQFVNSIELNIIHNNDLILLYLKQIYYIIVTLIFAIILKLLIFVMTIRTK